MNQVTTLAGGGPGAPGRCDNTGTEARFFGPTAVSVNTENGDIVVADCSNNRIRKIAKDGQVTTVAGSGSPAFGDGQSIAAHFNCPCGVAITKEGWIVVADTFNHRIRIITTNGKVATLAGSEIAGFADGSGIEANFNYPEKVAIDRDGNVIVADTGNHRIRMVTRAGQVTTLAGSGNADFGDGKGILAHFNRPSSLAVSNRGDIYVADGLPEDGNQRICNISPEGKVTTIFIFNIFEENGADGSETNTYFFDPVGIVLDGDQNLIVATSNRLEMISPDDNVTIIAGNGISGFSNGPGLDNVMFNFPTEVDVDNDGNIIVVDRENHCIRKIAAQLTPPRHGALPPYLSSEHAPGMAKILEDPTFADVIFLVEETELSAHKAVLVSSCDYFKAMFTSGFQEGQGRHGGGAIDVPTITIGETTASAFKVLLRYIYTGMLEFEDKDVLNVMAKAREIQLERVYNYTVWYCHHNVRVDNAVLWLIQADELKLEDLRESTLWFLVRNFGAVRDCGSGTDSVGTLDLLQERPALLMELTLAIHGEFCTAPRRVTPKISSALLWIPARTTDQTTNPGSCECEYNP